MERWFFAFIIVSAASVAIIAAVTYYASQPGEQYYLVIQHQWRTPPMTSTTAPFTISGREWYVDWTYVSYSLVSHSLSISVRNASTDALLEQVTLTNQQRTAYFDLQGKFYLSIILNNVTNVEDRSVLVAVWELR